MAKWVHGYGKNARVRLSGDWEKLQQTLSYLQNNFHAEAKLLQQSQALRLKTAILSKAVSGDLGYKPDHPARPNNTHLWWIETWELLNHLMVRQEPNARGGAYIVGFGSGKHSPPPKGGNGYKPIAYKDIGYILEQKLDHPLFAMVWDDLEPVFLQEWNELMLKAIRGGM